MPPGAGGQPVKATAQSTGPDALWRGGGIRVRGAAPGTLVIERVHLLGGREIAPAGGAAQRLRCLQALASA